MFNAIKQAYKGQAGFPATLLAYLLLALTVIAVVVGLPRIETAALSGTQSALLDAGYSQPTIDSVRAQGRDISVAPLAASEETNKALTDTIESVEGVRRAQLDAEAQAITSARVAADVVTEKQATKQPLLVADEMSSDQSEASTEIDPGDEVATQQTDEVVTTDEVTRGAEPVTLTGDEQPADQGADTAAHTATQTAPEVNTVPAANMPAALVAFFDNGNLNVSGLLPEQADVEVFTREIAQMRRPGLTTIEIRGGAAASGLQWKDDFLGAVAGIPHDAVGKVTGSDQLGVEIFPGVRADQAESVQAASMVKTPQAAPELKNDQQLADPVPAEESLAKDDTPSQVEGDQVAAESVVEAQADSGTTIEVEPKTITDLPKADLPMAALSAYFDEGSLKVTGILPEQMDVGNMTRALTQLRRVGLTTIEIRHGAAASGLEWKDDFLGAIASIPGDAVGKISGSDQSGIEIVPEATPAEVKVRPTAKAISPTSEIEPVIEAQAASEDALRIAEAQVAPQADNSIEADSTQSLQVEVGEDSAVPADERMNTRARGGFSIGMNSDLSAAGQQRQDATSNHLGDHLRDDSRTVTRSPGPVINSQKQALTEVAQDGATVEEPDLVEGVNRGDGESSALDYIVNLNYSLSGVPLFRSGEADEFSPAFSEKLGELVVFLNNYPNTLIRIVGNVDFTVDPRDGEYVGVRRARAVRDYLRNQGIDSFRIFAAPLPRGYAFDEQTQIVFYISE